MDNILFIGKNGSTIKVFIENCKIRLTFLYYSLTISSRHIARLSSWIERYVCRITSTRNIALEVGDIRHNNTD